MTQRYVWPSIKKDCRVWAQSCLQCQRAKVSRHVSTTPGTFPLASRRFEHVHIDIVIMPSSEGFRYCLTCVDRFSRWPEAVPLPDQEAATVARAFYTHWISRFGTPLRITTDQGRQFESHLFRELNCLTGTHHFHTTAYHPAANGMVERFHRQLKAAIKCHEHSRWTEILPSVMLGIRAAWKDDLQATVAEMIYGEPLRLPGEFLSPSSSTASEDQAANYVQMLKQHALQLHPTAGSRHGNKSTFMFQDLATTRHVFVRHDGPRAPLQQPYEGPFRVISRSDKTFVVRIRNRDVTVSIDRLKPAYVLAENDFDHRAATPEDIASPTPSTSQPEGLPHGIRTRAGRTVRFADRFQAGFS